ncbi:MAG: bifunctional DNA-formamidopyrimidine glycosylase/DNA-(apurinic or apyrimidinic site) lyase [Planctomycetota bacterium]|nr:bifunctional DNA-formamidopyrimidine glycosylase/DNA-(apurinic or apyrimidinic site) lyase [Planctomycetota bacterium]
MLRVPELPEVETVRTGLAHLLPTPCRIQRLELRRRDLRREVPANLPRLVKGQAITALRRRAKFLIWDLERHSLINHLGMTGSWRAVTGTSDKRRHDHVVIHLADGRRLVYHDPRRFGLLDVVAHESEDQHPWIATCGPEPLDPTQFTPAYLAGACARRRCAIKVAIMTNAVVVGVGNIYAAEALFRAGIKPHTPAGSVSKPRIARLVTAIRTVLSEAIAAGGSTIKDFRQAGGSSGYFQTRFAVYGRDGQDCTACGSTLKHAVLGQRATVWCPRCQR